MRFAKVDARYYCGVDLQPLGRWDFPTKFTLGADSTVCRRFRLPVPQPHHSLLNEVTHWITTTNFNERYYI